NSLLELESTTKGFLPPRVTLTSVSSYAPLTSEIVAGMLVYNSGSTISEGFYYWTGTAWRKLEGGPSSPVIKTASATLTKNETFVLVNPSGTAATITLPAITSIDNGLEITVKNMGSYDDLVTIQRNGSSTVDGGTTFYAHRWDGITFIANGGNWLIKQKENIPDNIMDVNSEGSWTTIEEAIAYLNLHMTGPTVVRLGDGTYTLSATQVINLAYPVTFQGLSYGTTSIVPHATNLLGKTMFRCFSDCYFKMLNFTFNEVASYGDGALEDAIHFLGEDTYNEIKDCTFEGFYNTIIDSTSAELWIFEVDITDANRNGILLHSGVSGASIKTAETDFINCNRGINMDKGSAATVQLTSSGYYNNTSTDSAIIYKPSTFTSFSGISITGNSWNNTGVYISGFDFTRSDGRDANALLANNAGVGDKTPSCYINLLNSSTTTSMTTANVWYKANWTNTSEIKTKYTISNNRLTYQPTNVRDVLIVLAGNMSLDIANSNISYGIVKNGSSGTRYGESTSRLGPANVATQFSTVAFITNVAAGDYFELWVSDNYSGEVLTILDINWQVIAQ
ncbi:MAG: hypothetical protein ACKVQB_09395, partial [Bacteroidia bacterium]